MNPLDLVLVPAPSTSGNEVTGSSPTTSSSKCIPECLIRLAQLIADIFYQLFCCACCGFHDKANTKEEPLPAAPLDPSDGAKQPNAPPSVVQTAAAVVAIAAQPASIPAPQAAAAATLANRAVAPVPAVPPHSTRREGPTVAAQAKSDIPAPQPASASLQPKAAVTAAPQTVTPVLVAPSLRVIARDPGKEQRIEPRGSVSSAPPPAAPAAASAHEGAQPARPRFAAPIPPLEPTQLDTKHNAPRGARAPGTLYAQLLDLEVNKTQMGYRDNDKHDRASTRGNGAPIPAGLLQGEDPAYQAAVAASLQESEKESELQRAIEESQYQAVVADSGQAASRAADRDTETVLLNSAREADSDSKDKTRGILLQIKKELDKETPNEKAISEHIARLKDLSFSEEQCAVYTTLPPDQRKIFVDQAIKRLESIMKNRGVLSVLSRQMILDKKQDIKNKLVILNSSTPEVQNIIAEEIMRIVPEDYIPLFEEFKKGNSAIGLAIGFVKEHPELLLLENIIQRINTRRADLEAACGVASFSAMLKEPLFQNPSKWIEEFHKLAKAQAQASAATVTVAAAAPASAAAFAVNASVPPANVSEAPAPAPAHADDSSALPASAPAPLSPASIWARRMVAIDRQKDTVTTQPPASDSPVAPLPTPAPAAPAPAVASEAAAAAASRGKRKGAIDLLTALAKGKSSASQSIVEPVATAAPAPAEPASAAAPAAAASVATSASASAGTPSASQPAVEPVATAALAPAGPASAAASAATSASASAGKP